MGSGFKKNLQLVLTEPFPASSEYLFCRWSFGFLHNYETQCDLKTEKSKAELKNYDNL
jgi:hypothetical protein